VVSVFKLGSEHQQRQQPFSQAGFAWHAAGKHLKTESRQPPPAKQGIAAPQAIPKQGSEPAPSRRLAAATAAAEWEEF
jgi:hypothetical protein